MPSDASSWTRAFAFAILSLMVLASSVHAIVALTVPAGAQGYVTTADLPGKTTIEVDAGARLYVTDSFTRVHTSLAGAFKFSDPAALVVDDVLIAQSTMDVYAYDANRQYPYVKVVTGSDMVGSNPLAGLRFYFSSSPGDYVYIKSAGAFGTPTPVPTDNLPRHCVNAQSTNAGEYCIYGCSGGYCRTEPTPTVSVGASASVQAGVTARPPAPTLTVVLPVAPSATASLTLSVPSENEWRTLDTPSGSVTAYFAIVTSTRADTFRGQSAGSTYYTGEAQIQISPALEAGAPPAGTVYLTRLDINGNAVTKAVSTSGSITSSNPNEGLVAFVYEGSQDGYVPFSKRVYIKTQSTEAPTATPAAQTTSAPASPATSTPAALPTAEPGVVVTGPVAPELQVVPWLAGALVLALAAMMWLARGDIVEPLKPRSPKKRA